MIAIAVEFLGVSTAALGGLMLTSLRAEGAEAAAAGDKPPARQPATVRVAFLYPPSKTFAGNPDGWWSWPGNDFDAEGRQRQYTAALREMEKKLGLQLAIDDRPVANQDQAQALAKELEAQRPDGLLLIMFYNRSLDLADLLLKAAETAGIPVVFYIGLGVKHGTGAPVPPAGRVPDPIARQLGSHRVRPADDRHQEAHGPEPAAEHHRGAGAARGRRAVLRHHGPRDPVRPLCRGVPQGADRRRGPRVHRPVHGRGQGAARHHPGVAGKRRPAHLALKKMLADEQADGVTMNCLRRGMLKPCISFATLNSQLIPAACENDFPAVYTQLLGSLLTGRPGFQHNPCYDTEKNHYYGSHCTCPTKLYGPDGPELPYLLRRFAHTNEGSCAIQVFWKEGDPVTMVRYYPGNPPALDVYAGKVVVSHPMPPAGGCTTNVEIEVTDRSDACLVAGHHNLLFCGDFARKFRLFAQLYKMKLVESGFQGPWPV